MKNINVDVLKVNKYFLRNYPRLDTISSYSILQKDAVVSSNRSKKKSKLLDFAKAIGDRNFLLIPFLRAREFENGFLEKEIGGNFDRYLKYIYPLNLAFEAGFYTLSPHVADVILDSLILANDKRYILILGESGVGKSLLVKLIAAKVKLDVVSVNCAAIPEELAESELFGHTKGAFTGAFNNKLGFVEKADKDILFLDEIHGLPLSVYRKLLRLLDTGEFYSLGSPDKKKSIAQIIFASNQDLEDPNVRKDNHFPDDLYSRIEPYPALLKIPPLRDRVSDIPFFIYCIIKDIIDQILPKPKNKTSGRNLDQTGGSNLLLIQPTISRTLLQAFMLDKWTGNNRRFKRLLEHSWSFESHNVILQGERYFDIKKINLNIGRDRIIKRALYYELTRNLTPAIIHDTDHPALKEVFGSYGIGIDQLPYLEIKEFMKQNYLPHNAYYSLSEQNKVARTLNLNDLAEQKSSTEDVLALYILEVERAKGSELKNDRVKQIGWTLKTYNKYLNRGKELMRTRI